MTEDAGSQNTSEEAVPNEEDADGQTDDSAVLEEGQEPELVERVITDKKGLVTVSGMLTEKVTVTARKMTEKEIKALAPEGFTVHAAYDITLWLDGKEYQPKQ